MSRPTDKERQKLKEMDKRREERAADQKKATEVTQALTMRHTTGTLWELVILDIQDGKVIKETVKECSDKQHAVEAFQIEFVHTFIYGK